MNRTRWLSLAMLLSWLDAPAGSADGSGGGIQSSGSGAQSSGGGSSQPLAQNSPAAAGSEAADTRRV